MKKMALTIAGLLLAGYVRAAEVEGNPDRFPSVGVQYIGASESGESVATAGGSSASQDVDLDNGLFLLDARIPLTANVTLTGAIGFSKTEVTAQETAIFAGQKTNTDGNSFSVGLRFYIH